MRPHTFVLSRRVGRPLHTAERTLVGLPPGEYEGLTFVGFFERRSITGPWGSGPPEREAPARLRVGRHGVQRVLVELGEWSHAASELRIRPVDRRPQRWGGRRQARYFEAAHTAIDALARTLERETAPVVAHQPEIRTA